MRVALISVWKGRSSLAPASLEIDRTEPLKQELEAFVAICRGENRRVVLGDAGRRALKTAYRVLEAIESQV